jgi:hypothetical protein
MTMWTPVAGLTAISLVCSSDSAFQWHAAFYTVPIHDCGFGSTNASPDFRVYLSANVVTLPIQATAPVR